MPTIDPNLLGRVSNAGGRAHSRQSPAKGGGQSVAGLDRLQIGSETVSADEAVKILAERVTSHILEALREAKVDVARGQALPLEVPAEAPADAVAKGLFDFALGSFKEFEAANPRMSAPDARRLFASLVAEAAGEALSETYNLLHGLKAFVSSELASKMETIRDMLVKMLEAFASEGQVDPRAEAREPEGFRPKGFAPKVASGREALFKSSGHAPPGQSGRPEVEGRGRLGGLLGAFTSGERAEEAAAGAQGAEGTRLASKQPSAEQATRILGDRILSNVRESLRELGVASAQGLSVEASLASSPEAVARRVFDAVVRMFGELGRAETAGRPPVSPEAFSRLVAEAVERGVADTLGFYRVMKTVLGAEAQANVDKVSSLLAKMMDEFVAEGLKELSPKALASLLSAARGPEAPPKEALAGSLPHPESAPTPESGSAPRSPEPGQAYLVPPESTVLAMTKRSLSKKLYTSGEPFSAPLTVSLKVSLGTLVGTLFGIAVVLNTPWEVAHLIIRYGWESLGPLGLFSSVKAAVGDGLLVVALYGMGCALFQDREWILGPKAGGYAFLAGAGAAVAFALEWHSSAWGRWAPIGLAPAATLFGVGLMPLLQFMVLPLIAAYLSRLWLWRYAPGGAPRDIKTLPPL